MMETRAAAALTRAQEFISGAEHHAEPPTFRLAEFQQSATEAARQILSRRGGVLIADGVGLGKTFVALALIEDELRRGGHVLITSPAALRRHWQLPLLRLARGYGCTTAGLTAESRRPRPGVAHLEWLSHTRMGRGWKRSELPVPQSFIVVDEAHGCRNPATRRYRALAAACLGTRVALITATPICNSLSDLYFLIRLFAADSAFQDIGVMDLGTLLRADRPDMERVRAVLRQIMVRRTRAGLLAEHGRLRLPNGGDFPQLAPPTVVRYPTAAGLPRLLERIEALRFPPFCLGEYGNRQSGGHGAELIRCMLLKRLESSDAAARSSLVRLTRYLASFIDALAAGRLLLPRDFRASAAAFGLGIEQLVLQQLVLEELPRRVDRRRLRHDSQAELRLLRQLLSELEGRPDFKLEALRETLPKEPGVIVFTEFQETARQLWRGLLRDGRRVARIDGGAAYLGAQRATRAGVISRFAPIANGCRPPHPRERVDILIATDLLSEGLNLQDARAVISYDLPWNPTRMMQRVGRIDRLGSPHERIASFVFMPGEHLEELLGLVRRIRRKLRVIADSVGTESPPLDPPSWVPDVAIVEALRDGRAIPVEDGLLLPAAADSGSQFAIFGDARGFAALAVQPDGGTVMQSAVVHVAESRPGVLLLGRLRGARAACLYDSAADSLLPLRTAQVRTMISGCTAGSADADLRLIDRAILTVGAATTAAPAPSAVAARATRRLLRALAAPDARNTPATLQRAEMLLRRLRAGLAIGPELRLRTLLRAPPQDADELISALEHALSEARADPGSPTFQPLIALEIRSPPGPKPVEPRTGSG